MRVNFRIQVLFAGIVACALFFLPWASPDDSSLRFVHEFEMNYHLLGTRVDTADPLLSHALLKRKGTTKSQHVMAGEKVMGTWMLTLVEEDKAHFVRDGSGEDVTLYVAALPHRLWDVGGRLWRRPR